MNKKHRVVYFRPLELLGFDSPSDIEPEPTVDEQTESSNTEVESDQVEDPRGSKNDLLNGHL